MLNYKWVLSAALFSFNAVTGLNALTLQEGVGETLSTHPVVQERLHNYRATLEDLRTTEAQYLPILDYSASIGRENTDSPSTSSKNIALTSYEHSLQLTQNLFNGFGTKYEADYNKVRILAAANHYVENVNDIAYSFVNNYINAIKARDLLCIAKANVVFNEEIYDKVTKLYSAGMTTRSESEKADTSLSLAKSNYVVAKNNLDDALYNLERIIGHSVKIEELQNATFSGKIPTSLEGMKLFSRIHNPSVLVSEYNLKGAKLQKEASYKNYYPKIDAYARQSWANDVSGLEGSDDRSKLGVMMSYNLYRGGADESLIQKNLSKIHQESENKREIIRKLDEQGELSWSAKTYLSQQIEHLKRYEITSAKTLELYQKEYDLGRRTLLDLLVAQNDHVAAKSQIVRAESDLLFAYFRITDAMGSMVQTILGSKAEPYTQKVGLSILDNDLKNDEKIGNTIFADRTIDKYRRDSE